MPPPFNIDETSPAASDLISGYPVDEQANRTEIEEWLTFISDPATGLIRPSVLPGSTSEFASGTKLLFVQTSAPTGWTKDVTHNNKALRLVNGTAGSGGSVNFTTAFAEQTPEGTLSETAAAGTIGSTTQGGTVGATTLTTAQLPSHTHTFSDSGSTSSSGSHSHTISASDPGGGTDVARGNSVTEINAATSSAGAHTHTFSVSGSTSSTGSGNSHTHTFTGNSHTHTFTGTLHGHTFTGSAMDLAVAYVDAIVATKD
jgi:hypothetical protein